MARTPMAARSNGSNGVTPAGQPDKGGHLAAWEQPQLPVADLRAAFKSLR